MSAIESQDPGRDALGYTRSPPGPLEEPDLFDEVHPAGPALAIGIVLVIGALVVLAVRVLL